MKVKSTTPAAIRLRARPPPFAAATSANLPTATTPFRPTGTRYILAKAATTKWFASTITNSAPATTVFSASAPPDAKTAELLAALSRRQSCRPQSLPFSLHDHVAQIVAALIGQLLQSLNTRLLLRRHVPLLTKIFLQVVQLRLPDRPRLILSRHSVTAGWSSRERAISMREHKLPRPTANCFELRAGPLAKRNAVKEVRRVRILGARPGR